MSARLRIAIADDHRLFRDGLRALLESRREVAVVAEAERADDVVAMLARTPADLLLLDLQMDRNTLADIGVLHAKVPVIALGASDNIEDSVSAVRRGARAVVHKNFTVDTLMEAIRAVAAGGVWLPEELQSLLAGMIQRPAPPLTPREQQVVRHVASGLRNAEVASRLFIGEETVKTHLTSVFRKLSLRDRVELTIYALRIGLVGGDEERAATD